MLYYYCTSCYNVFVIWIISLGKLLFGMEIDLLKPLLGAERRVDGTHVPKIIMRSHSNNITLPGGDPEASEHHFAAKTFSGPFFVQSVGSADIREPPNGFQ